MDSLLFLCARRVAAQSPLPALPPHLYPVLFQVAFLDGRALVLRDLVATWPFPVLNFQWLVGHRELLQDHDYTLCVEAVIQAVAAQLQRELEEPSHDFRWVLLQVLDMTGLSDSISSHKHTWMTIWHSTVALAMACGEVSKHQQEFQRHGSKQHKGCSGAATAALEPLCVDVHTDLCVDRTSFGIVRDALQTGATGPLRIKCRELEASNISASEIRTLLESLDPSCMRRLNLFFNILGLTELSEILTRLLRFPELRSLNLPGNTLDVQHPMPESTAGIRCLAMQLGMLPGLREFNLGSTRLSGNLCQILCDLQAPLESLGLGYCSLVPADLAFLSQSFHAPALKRLDLSGHNISQDLLEPLQLLLEETSASLLYLDLTDCDMADSHLATLLPTLLRCSRLRFLQLSCNPLSTAAIKDLLQKALELPDLHLVVYPVPKNCYKREPSGFSGICVLDEELLVATTTEISQLLANSGRTDLVWTHSPLGHGALDYFSL
ncbi:LRC14 protein, partial [Copsychus sechellarum]|nr:LRC14 protein [Copsychus sechellarum]